jgi:hypothetical protein
MTRKAVSKKRGVQKRTSPRRSVARTQKHLVTVCGVEMQPQDWLVLASVVLFGVWLRFWNLSEWAIGGDDAIHSIIAFRKSALDTLMYSIKFETHPPLKYVMLYGVIKYVSASPDVIRLIGAISGILLMPAMYVLGRTLMGRTAAVFLLLATALSPTIIIQSQNVRAYSLCQLALVVAMVVAWRYMHHPKIKKLALYFAMLVLAVLMEYAAILPAMAMGITLLCVMGYQQKKITPHLEVILVGHALVLMVWSIQLGTYLNFRSHLQPHNISYVAHGFITSLGSLGTVLPKVTSGFLMVAKNPLYYPFTGLFLIGAALLTKERNYRVLLYVVSAFALAIVASVLKKYPMTDTRHAMWLMMFTYLLPAYFFQWSMDMTRKKKMVQYVLLLIVSALPFSNAALHEGRFLTPDFYRFGAYYKGVFAEQEVRHEDFVKAIWFLSERMDKGNDLVVVGVADSLRMDYYIRIYKQPLSDQFLLKPRLRCRSWHNYNAKQLENCIYRIWEAYPDQKKDEKETRKEVLRLQAAHEVYILTGHNDDIAESSRFVDWQKPHLILPTLAVFAASPELRGHFMNPPPTRPVPAPIP